MNHYIIVPCTKISGTLFAAKIDMTDSDLVLAAKWGATGFPPKNVYARLSKPLRAGGPTGIHQIVAERIYGFVPNGMMVDHINRDSLDCRRLNLRLVTASQNAMNRSNQQRTKGKYKGIHKTPGGKWQVRLRRAFLGNYLNAEDAALAYDRAAIDMFGVLASTNQSLGLIRGDDGRKLSRMSKVDVP